VHRTIYRYRHYPASCAGARECYCKFRRQIVLQVTVKDHSKTKMIKNQRIRRTIAAILVVLGAILMLLAPEVWPGALLFVSGIVLELAGIALERKAK
jgi:membrane-anchored protein YejM (alkaline phosphatase superfamily)